VLCCAVELTYNYGVDSYDIGEGFGHFGVALPDVYKAADNIKALGGEVRTRAGGFVVRLQSGGGGNSQALQRYFVAALPCMYKAGQQTTSRHG
jgi:hypothetical protein